MVKRKLSRKELKEDEVLNFVQKAGRWFIRYQKPLIYGATAAVVLILIFWGGVSWKQSRENHAAVMLANALTEEGVDREALKTVADRYGGTKAGQSASFMLASESNEEEADRIASLTEMLPELKDPGLRMVACQNVVLLLVNDGKFEEAEEFLDLQKEKFAEDFLLYQKGFIAEMMGDSEGAKQIYEELVDRFEQSPHASTARVRSQYL